MRTFILLSAIPGSGKSTWADKYQREHPNTHIVASDDVRTKVSGAAQCFDNEQKVWKTFLQDINAFAEKEEDVTVIGDATNLTNHFRRYYREATPNFDHHILVVFDIPIEICERQNKMRQPGRIVPDYAMKKLEAEFEKLDEETLAVYDEVYVIDQTYTATKAK